MFRIMVVFGNGKICTVDGIMSWIRVEDGKFIEYGKEEISDYEDLKGQVVLPGLMDAHIHLLGMGKYMDSLSLRGVGSISEMQNKLSEYAKGREGWILGRGWDQDYFEDKRYPTANDLDIVVNDKPVMLFRGCNHIVLLNTKAMEIAELSSDAPDPKGGQIDRDAEGHLTGILREKALDYISKYTKIMDYQVKKRMIKLALDHCASLGLTLVQSNDSNAWQVYKELQREGKLPIRVVYTPYHTEIGQTGIPQAGTRDGWLYCDRVKVFADGSLGAQTAALREPYADTGELGIPIHTQEELDEIVKQTSEAGYRLEVHAIGDLAAEMVIKSITNQGNCHRPILTHCQVLGNDLIENMRELGIIANIQPPFVITDGEWVDKRLGYGERRNYAYAWKSLLKREVICAGGSDSPIESANPLVGMYSAMFRETARGKQWRIEEALSFEEALHLYSAGAAFATLEENRLGSIKPGYLADFVVVDHDVLAHPRDLKQAKITAVFIEGKQVFRQF